MDLERYYASISGTDPKEIAETTEEEALKKTKTRMIVNAVAEQENFQVTDEEVNAGTEENGETVRSGGR